MASRRGTQEFSDTGLLERAGFPPPCYRPRRPPLHIDRAAWVTHLHRVMARSTILSAGLTGSLTEVGVKLRQGSNAGAELATALTLLAGLEPGPGHVARADGESANATGLHHYSPQPLASRRLSPRPSDAEQLVRTPGSSTSSSFIETAGFVKRPF